MVAEYWMQIVDEPQQKMQDRWEECLKNWGKINHKMRDISLPEFDMPDDFINLNDVVKQCMESDEKLKVMYLKSKGWKEGNSRDFDGLIGASWVLRHLSPKIDWFKYQVMEMKDRLSALDGPTLFPILHTCEDLFS
jgi:hypothetical protein